MAQKAKKAAAKKSASKGASKVAAKVKARAKQLGAKAKTVAQKAGAKKGAAPKKGAPPKKGAVAKKGKVTKSAGAKGTSSRRGPEKLGDRSTSTRPGPAKTKADGAAPRRVSARLAGATVDDYIASVPAPFKAVLAELRQVVMTAAPETDCSIKWGQPVFECNGPFAWMKGFPRYASIGFWRGAELPDPDGILQGSGSRMRHVKISEPEHVPVAKIDALVRAAVALNREKGDPSKRANR